MALLCFAVSAASLHATVLVKDSLNYPYTNGPIAGQGQWYVYSSGTHAYDTIVSNNVIYLNTTNKDDVATPTNGFYSPANGTIVYASFTLNVSQSPSFNNYNGSYFAQFLSTNGNYCCNLFISTNGAVIPGTYRLSIANFSVSFSNLQQPVTYPEDLLTNVTYNIVIAYDTSVGSTTEGANLMVDPSEMDYENLINGDPEGYGFVYGTDLAINATKGSIETSALGLSPYVNAGISNVIIATTFAEVYSPANPPVFGIQPVSGSAYSGNSAVFYAAAAGSDLTYQWYSTTYGALSDGADFTGSTSNILVVNNLTATDSYYVVATDAAGNSTTSFTATESVNTTPTPVSFGPGVTAVNTTNNLFTGVTFADYATGTGPISYQWYFESTNAGSTFVALPGQNGPTINLNLADYTTDGKYYVVASNGVNGGTTATGPTNTLVEIAPLVATMEQLHTYLENTAPQIAGNPGGTVYINTNNVTVSGYVSVYRGYGSTYTEFWVQDTNGYGVEVFLSGHGNTNTPPIGTYVTVSGELEVYHSGLELAPSSVSAIVTNPAPPVALYPFLGNPYYAGFTANPIGTNALRYTDSLVTFTNVYLYGNATGGPFGSGVGSAAATSGVGGIFTSNSYCILYITVGAPYDSVTNNQTMEIFQPTYDYRNGSASIGGAGINPFDFQPIPTHVAQLTGVLLPYGGSPSYVEVIPSRYQDYMVSNPPPFSATLGAAGKSATVSWPTVTGATYSLNSATKLNGPWKTEGSGLTYYPTNGVFVQPIGTNTAKFFQVTSP
jgi:hypothetical protein